MQWSSGSGQFKEKTMNEKMNYQSLIAQINQQVEELAQATDAARMSEDMLRYLDAFSRFHRYSLYNMWLILMSRPDATHVAASVNGIPTTALSSQAKSAFRSWPRYSLRRRNVRSRKRTS